MYVFYTISPLIGLSTFYDSSSFNIVYHKNNESPFLIVNILN